MKYYSHIHNGNDLPFVRYPQRNHDNDADEKFNLAEGTGVTHTDETQTAIPTAATGIYTGQSPLQFMSAIDTAHTHMGNRAFMHYVRQQCRQQVHDVARDGFRDTPRAYPYLEQIQHAFGEQHDISGLKAYTGVAARTANARLGSRAFHKGGHVAFTGRPSLDEAAHEAAHYVQNAHSEELEGGFGETYDDYERHADRVADAVAEGRSAASLLWGAHRVCARGGDTADDSEAPVQMMGGNILRRLIGAGRYGIASSGRRMASDEPSPVFTPNDDGTYSYGDKRLKTPGYDPLDGVVGPLPGPEGHTDFAYSQWRQDAAISPLMMTVHSTFGAVRKGADSEKRLLVELMRNEHLAGRYPVVGNEPLYKGNIGGTLAPVWIKEVNTAQTQPVAVTIVPVEDVDPIIQRLLDSFTPKEGPEAESLPFWNFSSEDCLRSCSAHAELELRAVNHIDPKAREIFDSIALSGKLRDSFKVYEELVKRGYLRYYDRPDTAERVDIWNKNMQDVFNEWYFRMRGEKPVDMLPEPLSYNAQFGVSTRYNPYESLLNKHPDERYFIDKAQIPGMLLYLRERNPR